MLTWLTGYEGIPYLARHTFRYEFIAVFTFAIAAAAMEGNFAQFFVAKTFSATGWVVAAISAGGALGNLTAALTAPLLRRRQQVPLMVLRMLVCGLLLGVVAILPPSEASGYVFAGVMLLIAMLNATATNARTTLWQANYPVNLRGQIISRFILMNMIVIMFLVKLQSWLLDRYPWFYRVLFLLAALSGLATALLYTRVRIRGEEARLRQEVRRPTSVNPLEVCRVLTRDRLFGKYMVWQMCLGSATLLGEPVIILVLKEKFGASYSTAMLPLVIAPMLVQLVSTPLLGRLYDTMNIFIYRGIGAACWGVGRFILFAGAMLLQMPLMFLGRNVTGLGGSFGGLAWSLGHMNFAPPDQSPLYMGAHMLLTGIRGAIMPFLGVLLYEYTPVGIHVLWISGALHLVAAFGLWRMRKVVLPYLPGRGFPVMPMPVDTTPVRVPPAPLLAAGPSRDDACDDTPTQR